MSLLYNQRSGKRVQEEEEEENNCDDYSRRSKIRRTSSLITNLPGEILNHVFNCLENTDDRNSFGLTCHEWLQIQNINQDHLFYPRRSHDGSFPVVLCKLLNRFQHLKILILISDYFPEIIDFAASKPPCIESKVEYLCLFYCYENSDIELPSVLSWFPHVTNITLRSSHITDKGLEALPKCCPSLKKVKLLGCPLITDSGISFLLQNCRKLDSFTVQDCSKITGIGFPETLTSIDEAERCQFKPIVSSGGIECLILSAPYGLAEDGDTSISTEAIVAISKGFPSLKKLELKNCTDVELEGWEAIGQNCRNLEHLSVHRCTKLCDLGLEALCNGCSKLTKLLIDGKNDCSSSALKLFKCKRPNVSFA